MQTRTGFERREFLKLSLAAGGALLVTIPLGGAEAASTGSSMLNAFVRIEPDGPITLIMPKVEMGQGTFTSLPMLIAEELEVGLDQIRTEHAPPNPKVYGIDGDQSTGGSTSVLQMWEPLRRAGATARTALIAAAASTWQVGADSCHAERGEVVHAPSGRRLAYGALASRAARAKLPHTVALKDPKDFKLIGRPTRRLDAPSKVDGRATFGIDVRRPGMRYAALEQTPVKGGRLQHADEAAARRLAGVRQVVVADDVVAVIADNTYAARRGLEALAPRWDGGPHGHLQQADLVAALDRAVDRKGARAKRIGDVDDALRQASRTLEARYHQPFLAHATMEPMNCTVHWHGGRCEIWVGTQAPDRVVSKLADLGLKPENIVLHNHLIGGGFGRRLEVDTVVVAARIAQKVAGPVQVIWSRAEDIRQDRYRPAYVDHIAAALDAHGNPIGWRHTIAGGSATAQWDGKPLKTGVDDDAVESSKNPAYLFPNLSVHYVQEDPPNLTVSWWRGVGPTRSVFVVESFIDECAAAAGKDPVAYRRPLLADGRARRVLDIAAERAGWGSVLPKGHGRGVSVQSAFGSHLAQVVEVAVEGDDVRVVKVVCAIDCGRIVNPDGVRSQLEGGVIFGLSAALFSEITVANGRVEQSNFDDYPVLRMDGAPSIEVHLVESSESPGGIGETGTACVAAALGNAIHAATGRRLRTLPFRKSLRET